MHDGVCILLSVNPAVVLSRPVLPFEFEAKAIIGVYTGHFCAHIHKLKVVTEKIAVLPRRVSSVELFLLRNSLMSVLHKGHRETPFLYRYPTSKRV